MWEGGRKTSDASAVLLHLTSSFLLLTLPPSNLKRDSVHRQHWTPGCPRGLRRQGCLEEDLCVCVKERVKMCVFDAGWRGVWWFKPIHGGVGVWNKASASACGSYTVCVRVTGRGGFGCNNHMTIALRGSWSHHTVLKPHAYSHTHTHMHAATILLLGEKPESCSVVLSSEEHLSLAGEQICLMMLRCKQTTSHKKT